jgi:hypothetical protein
MFSACRLDVGLRDSGIAALTSLLLGWSTGAALAVVGTPPTVTCDAVQCQTCIECENDKGACRCLKCGVAPQCLGSDPGLPSDFTEMLKAHNNYRAQHGTPALSWSPQLAKQVTGLGQCLRAGAK